MCSCSVMHNVWDKDPNVAGSSPGRGDTEINLFLGLHLPASCWLALSYEFPCGRSALVAQCIRFGTKTSTSPVRVQTEAIPRKIFFLG